MDREIIKDASPSAWLRLLILFTLASLGETIFYSQMLAFTPLYLPQLGATSEAEVLFLVGMISATSNGVGIPFLPFWGALADRFSRKPIIIRSFVVILIAGLLAYLSESVWLFFLARSLTGFALGNSGLMMTTLSERLPQNRIGFGFSIMNSAAPVGAFLGPFTGGWIVDAYGFRTLLLLNSVAISLIILALSFGYQDTYRGEVQDSIFRMAWESVRLIGKSRRLLALFPALFLLFGGWMLAFTYIPLVITELYTGEDAATVVGLVIGASGFTTLILGPLLGTLADRYGGWRVLFAGAALALVMWPLPGLTRDLILFAIIWSLLNGVVAAVFALSFSVISSSAGERVRGRIMSFAYMPVNIGFMVGPAVATRITQTNIFHIFPASALFTALGLAALFIAYRQPVVEETLSSQVL
jgi:DHA1 family multidrug resistance protein-like MFS transporter